MRDYFKVRIKYITMQNNCQPPNEKIYVMGEMDMNGQEFARIIEKVLAERGIRKGDFYEAVGISATALYGWKNGAMPKKETVDAIEKYLEISLEKYEKSDESDESTQLREILRDRQDLRILLHSAKDVPPSSVYALIAQIEKLKEDST